MLVPTPLMTYMDDNMVSCWSITLTNSSGFWFLFELIPLSYIYLCFIDLQLKKCMDGLLKPVVCKVECIECYCSERPALLFEVRCADHDISLGGAPFRYIISPYNARGQFHVCSLETKTLVG